MVRKMAMQEGWEKGYREKGYRENQDIEVQ